MERGFIFTCRQNFTPLSALISATFQKPPIIFWGFFRIFSAFSGRSAHAAAIFGWA
jgi:hypothetical protein